MNDRAIARRWAAPCSGTASQTTEQRGNAGRAAERENGETNNNRYRADNKYTAAQRIRDVFRMEQRQKPPAQSCENNDANTGYTKYLHEF